jgi:hypothetical protein
MSVPRSSDGVSTAPYAGLQKDDDGGMGKQPRLQQLGNGADDFGGDRLKSFSTAGLRRKPLLWNSPKGLSQTSPRAPRSWLQVCEKSLIR